MLDADKIAKFAAGLRGDLIRSGDVGYDAARRLYNGMIDKHPLIIARCTNVADVIASSAVASARRRLGISDVTNLATHH